MNPSEVRDVLEHHGAILRGHFRLSSGRHSDTYVQCARVLEHPRIAFSLGSALARHVTERFGAIDAVASPALGALLIGYPVAHALDVRFVFAERVDGAMTFRRGQDLRRGERVVVVEDAVTTGGSAKEVVDLAQAAGARPAGVASIVDRTGGQPPFALVSLLRVEAVSHSPDDCPQCASGAPLTAPGSRHLPARG